MYFGLFFVLAATPSCWVWRAFGAIVQRFLHTDRALRLGNLATGAILAGSILLSVL